MISKSLPDSKKCNVAVIGLGYVGLPLAQEIYKVDKCLKTNSRLKRNVLGFDISNERIQFLEKKFNKSDFIKDKNQLKKSNTISFSDNDNLIINADIYIIAVPTPIDKARRPDLTALKKACQSVGKAIKVRKENLKSSKQYKDPIIVFESTVYPGATEEECIKMIEIHSKLKPNSNGGFFYGYSPERINPGDNFHQLSSITKIVSGSNIDIANWLDDFYGSFIKAGIHIVSSVKVAEAAKIIENTQRDLNIALVNELAVICDLLKIDTSEVLDAACTKWNFHDFRPGLVGGHCIGIDPYYLTHKAEQLGYHPEVVLAGRKINDSMSKWVAQKIILELSKRKLFSSEVKVLVLGLTYKANCSDLRNSQVINLIKFLDEHNINVDAVDPIADIKTVNNLYSIKIRNDIPKNEKYTVVLLAVSHKQFLSINNKEWINLLMDQGFFFDLSNSLPQILKPIRI